jgi:hypothetical protein
MSKYWPDGIELKDTQSPNKILKDAKAEWTANSDGLLELLLQEAESKSGHDMIIVHAKHMPSNRTASLFSVVCRKGQPYPARLQPKDDEMPDFFKKSYKTKNLGAIGAMGVAYQQFANVGDEKWVENHWVADTPTEFREKLEEVFNLGNIKSEILNLISSKADDIVDNSQIKVGKTDDPIKTSDIAEDEQKPSPQGGETFPEG